MASEKRLIDANEAYEIARGSGRHNDFARSRADLTSLEEVLEECTTVDAVEVVHGYWRYYSTTMQECSNCQRHTARHKFKYCPHCGAIMEDKYNDG